MACRTAWGRIDVLLYDEDLAARAILWDGPDLNAAQAPLVAAPYAAALSQLHTAADLTTIGVWQARRQSYFEVPVSTALRHVPTAQRLQFTL